MLPAITIVGIMAVGFILFGLYSRQLDAEDKGMAASLTSGGAALIAAVVAWHLVGQQLRISRQQANIALSEVLARQISQIEDVRRQLDKLNNDTVSGQFGWLDPIPLNLTEPGPMPGPQPDLKRYEDIKAKINVIWPEADVLATTLTGLRNGESKSEVVAYLTAISSLKTLTHFSTRIIDAMIKNGPKGGFAGEAYDPKRFRALRSNSVKLQAEIATDKYSAAVTALSKTSESLSKRLRIIDQSLDE
ncbi:MAG: hypothetical protein WA268_04860 [Xanthobacteraceae bacterium]